MNSRPSYEAVAVRADLKEAATDLRGLALLIDCEATSPRHSNPAARQHLMWAAEMVRSWADEAQLTVDTGDGLDQRAGLDTALTRHAIAMHFLRAWTGPLGVSE